MEQREAWEKNKNKINSGSVASKTNLFPPTVPERLRRKERRNNFRWVLTECNLLQSKQEKEKKKNMQFMTVPMAAVKMMQITCE